MIKFLDAVDRLPWLDPLGHQLQHLISAAFAALGSDTRALKNLLHGTWLGHPLHPVMTDVALGGWTVSAALDALDSLAEDDSFTAGADAALAFGLLGALGSAATGANDWQHTSGTARRRGTVHALLNVIGTMLMAASLVARLAGNRSAGRGLAGLGLGFGTASAFVGGDLVYGQQVGVNHAAGQDGPKEFTPVLADSELPEDQPRLAEVAGTRLVLVRHEGRVHALAEICSHAGGPLAEGTLEDGGIVCPWHGSRFNFEDGSVLDGPATFPQPCFQTRVREGQIEVRAR